VVCDLLFWGELLGVNEKGDACFDASNAFEGSGVFVCEGPKRSEFEVELKLNEPVVELSWNGELSAEFDFGAPVGLRGGGETDLVRFWRLVLSCKPEACAGAEAVEKLKVDFWVGGVGFGGCCSKLNERDGDVWCVNGCA